MKMNALKTKSFIISRSRSAYLTHPDITINNDSLENVPTMKFFGVIFHQKLSFVDHLNYISSHADSKLGIIWKALHTYNNANINLTCFRSFVLPLLEYCSPVWACASDTHLHSLTKVYNQAKFLFPNNGNYDLNHRRTVSSLSLFFKMYSNSSHPLHQTIPSPLVFNRDTRASRSMHQHCVELPRSRTVLYSRSFLPHTSSLWNELPSHAFEKETLSHFKSSINRSLKQQNLNHL